MVINPGAWAAFVLLIVVCQLLRGSRKLSILQLVVDYGGYCQLIIKSTDALLNLPFFPHMNGFVESFIEGLIVF